ncbi:PilZ domain-containing protein [Trujillonella humicola]|uniref:PilZ domain-containing protein n=1 Tax=Trujillonella humicola TaxID=3383699 RepID=UPI00390694EC
MDSSGVDLPEVDSAVDVTSLRRGIAVEARVQVADAHTLLVRPSAGDYVGDVVAAGEPVEVFWQGPAGGRALTAEVVHVDGGAAPRWHLAVTAPAEDRQRRTAVRCRLTLPVTVGLRGVDLAGETRDLSEAGVRVLVEGFGAPPDLGTPLGLAVDLGDGVAWYRAEVQRVQSRGPDWLMSLRLVDPAERDQDRLRRRVFQELRAERARTAGV